MNESIEVRYKDTGVRSTEGNIMYHKYLIYTDKNGKEYYARGGSSLVTNGNGITPLTPMGKINADHGEYVRNTLDWREVGRDEGEPITNGPDLSDLWQSIKDTLDAIEDKQLPLPCGINSTVPCASACNC